MKADRVRNAIIQTELNVELLEEKIQRYKVKWEKTS